MSKVLEKAREMTAEEAEDYLLTTERLRRFDETRQGITADQLRQWMIARRDNPDAPCPTPQTIK